MNYSLRLPTAVLASVLALGCADQQSPSGTAEPGTPSLRASVSRTTEPFGFAFSDAQQTVFVGLGIEDLTSIFCTGTDFTPDEVNALHLLRPDSSLKDQLKGDVRVVIVDQIDEFFCDDPTAVPTYTGTARLVINDNDFYVTGNRADAAMFHLTGTVTDQTGQLYHFVASNQSVIAPGHPAPDFVFLHEEVKIHLTPFGG